jgi:hypothetical protein
MYFPKTKKCSCTELLSQCTRQHPFLRHTSFLETHCLSDRFFRRLNVVSSEYVVHSCQYLQQLRRFVTYSSSGSSSPFHYLRKGLEMFYWSNTRHVLIILKSPQILEFIWKYSYFLIMPTVHRPSDFKIPFRYSWCVEASFIVLVFMK